MIEIVTLCDPNPILSGTFTMNDRAGEFEPVWTKEEHKIKTTSLLDLWNTYLCSKKRRKDDTSVSRITKLSAQIRKCLYFRNVGWLEFSHSLNKIMGIQISDFSH